MVVNLVLAMVSGLVAARWHHGVGIAPMLAGLLCASCFLRRRDMVVVGVGAVLVRDVLVGVSVFTLVRLVAVLGVVGILWVLRVRPTFRSLLTGLVASSPIYHLVLAVGDWLTQTCIKAPLTPQGLWTSLATSMPYFQRSFLSDVVWASVFLSVYALLGYAVVLRWPSVLPLPQAAKS